MPVDGLVLSGKSHADESMLTGEAEPVLKSEGNAVIGGTMNLGGTLQVPSCPHSPHWVPARLHVLVRSVENESGDISVISSFCLCTTIQKSMVSRFSVPSGDLLHHGCVGGLCGFKRYLPSLLSLLEQIV
jgi:P-type E1-E2 ATPase